VNKSVTSTIVKIVVASLLVGFALTFFNITPQGVLEALGGTAKSVFEIVLRFFRWAMEYILIGAVVVIPIWLFFWAWRRFRGK
jgi:Na+/H+-dicarboxylate symporter